MSSTENDKVLYSKYGQPDYTIYNSTPYSNERNDIKTTQNLLMGLKMERPEWLFESDEAFYKKYPHLEHPEVVMENLPKRRPYIEYRHMKTGKHNPYFQECYEAVSMGRYTLEEFIKEQ